ncbi:hypothetical protein Cpir12675_006216 [Ceratocystis pirilliformis]|uniref:Aminoglycoside phosphotransferase domain-containing protein n=1 Tax=Ceratocystis pirilliformis TaxID=259994 RepID=A0ABR3YKC2_9PEZI
MAGNTIPMHLTPFGQMHLLTKHFAPIVHLLFNIPHRHAIMAFSSFSIWWLLPLSTRLRLGRTYFKSLGPIVVQVSAHRIIKGPCYLCELEALLYVRKHNTISVPKVYRTYPASKGRIYIEMDLVEGVNLAELWLKMGLADDTKAAIMADLHDAVAQLRSLPPPTQQDIVASASAKEGLSDGRIEPETFGPFASHDAFHTFLRGGIPIETTQKTCGDSVFQVHSRHYKTHFTHADLVPRNIIISNGRIAAIVDWGFAGWYPEYWEYTKIHFDAFILLEWYKAVKEAIPRYDAELAAERALWQMYDEPGVSRR